MSQEPCSEQPVLQPGEHIDGDRHATSRSLRKRTVHHMRKLLANAAAAAVVLHLAGCGPLPPPPPPDCAVDLTPSDLDYWVYWRARWVQTEEEVLILVELDLDSRSNLAFLGEPALEGAALGESDVSTRSMGFTCIPLEGVTSVTISVPIICEGTGHTLQLLMDVRGTPLLGERVPISAGE
jgi:hypothetical protein